MSEKKRKIFTGAQKAKVALKAVKGMKAINEIALEHGVHPTQASQWKKSCWKMSNARLAPFGALVQVMTPLVP